MINEYILSVNPGKIDGIKLKDFARAMYELGKENTDIFYGPDIKFVEIDGLIVAQVRV